MEKTKPTTASQSRRKSQLDPHAAALSQVEHDTAGQQERVHKAATRDARAKEAKALKDDLTAPPEGRDKVAADTRTQAEKFADAAREHGADESEDAFAGVLRKLASQRNIS